jgi:hypothetical protein
MAMENTDQSGVNVAVARGAMGAILGAFAGSAIFVGLAKIGLYALIAPGALTGMGGAWLSRVYSPVVGVICIAVATAATILCEWFMFPFIVDGSLSYFVTHLHKLRTMAMLFGGIGIIVAFVFGKGSSPAV